MEKIFIMAKAVLQIVSVAAVCLLHGCSAADTDTRLEASGSPDDRQMLHNGLRTLSVSASAPDGNPDTRVTAGEKNGSLYRMVWEGSETLKLAEFADGELTVNSGVPSYGFTTDDGHSASFMFALDDAVSGCGFEYCCASPASATGDFDISGGKKSVRFTLPAEQVQTAAFADSQTVIIYAESGTFDEQADNISLRFRHVVGYGHLMIRGVATADDETISTVSFSAVGKALAGVFDYCRDEEACIVTGSRSESVTVDVSAVAKRGDGNGSILDIWFSTLPVEDIREAEVTVSTDKGRTFRRTVTYAADKALWFRAGKSSTFGINMEGIAADTPEQPSNDELLFAIGNNGDVSVASADGFDGLSALYSADSELLENGELGLLDIEGLDGRTITNIAVRMRAEGGTGEAAAMVIVDGWPRGTNTVQVDQSGDYVVWSDPVTIGDNETFGVSLRNNSLATLIVEGFIITIG